MIHPFPEPNKANEMRLAWSVLWFTSHAGPTTKNKITPHFIWSGYSKQLTGVWIHLLWNSLSLAPFLELCCSWWGYRKDVGKSWDKSQCGKEKLAELPKNYCINSRTASNLNHRQSPELWEGHLALRSAASPLPWSCRALREQGLCPWALGFFLSAINDTLESTDNSKDFPLKGRVWFHVQRRLPQKPAVSNEDFKALSYPCDTKHL